MLDNMTSSLQNALCCWSSSQQSPVDDRPSSPSSPESPCSAHSLECTCHRPISEKKPATTTTLSHCCYHSRQAQAQAYCNRQQQQQHSSSSKAATTIITPPSSAASSPSSKRTWPRSSHIKGVVAKKNNKHSAPSAHDVVSPYHSTTFMLTPPSAYHYDGYYSYHQHHHSTPSSASTSPGKSPSKRVSLQKYYYGRNSMSAARAAAFTSSPSSRTPSPPPSSASLSSSSPSSPTTKTTNPTLGSEFVLGSSASCLTTQPLSLSSAFMDTDMALATTNPGRPGTSDASFLSSQSVSLLSPPPLLSLSTQSNPSSALQGSNAGSSTFVNDIATRLPPLSLTITPTLTIEQDQDMPSQRRLSPPTLTTILATPVSPCPPSFPSSSPDSVSTLSPPFSISLVSTSPITPSSPAFPFSCSPSSSAISLSSSPPSYLNNVTSINDKIVAPEMSEALPFPASAMSAAKLANLLQQSDQETAGASAGSYSRRPLILDLRPHPEFYPVSITQSININLPTLLMRRYRRGGAVSSFALESFITIPSDKDVYHQILDSWRGASSECEPHDIVVLDQDMRAGPEEYGRSATAAWTLLNVLERGGGQGCFGGALVRVWYLEGGFEAFHAWDAGEKFLVRPGMISATLTASPSSSPNMGPVATQNNDQDVEMTLAKEQEKPVSRKPSLLTINTSSVSFVPKQRTPARRESLFSLNTKSLQRPSGLNRSQTVNLKPLVIPTINTQLPQRQQQQQPAKGGSWLTVPLSNTLTNSGVPGPTLSPAMSIVSNHSMEIAHSASTDRTSSSCWSADSNSINGSVHFPLATTAPAGGMVSMLSLNSKPSVSSLRTLNSTTSIREEDEDEFRHQSQNTYFNNNNNSQLGQEFHQEYNSRMFKNSISEQQYPSPPEQYHHNQQKFNDTHNTQYHHQSDLMDRAMSTYSSSDSLHSQPQYSHHQHHHHHHQDEEENFDDGEQEISCILPGFLYLGPEIVNADQVQTLERLGVKRILNMATECEDLIVSSKQNRTQFQYHKIGVYDHVEADVSAGLMQAVDIIAASKESPIYVHCKAGKSRSVTATIAYLITQLHWPLNKAYQHVLTQRPCMCPNIGFVTELMRMEEKTLGADKAGGLHVRS